MYDNEATLAGGALFNYGMTAITASDIYSNTAHSEGGAIGNLGLLLVDTTTLSQNVATGSQTKGGAIYSGPYSQLAVGQSSFISNTAQTDSCSGGAISVDGEDSEAFVQNSTFIGNRVACSSAAAGGALHTSISTTVELLNATFVDNTATHTLDGTAYGDNIYSAGTLTTTNVIASGSGMAGNCQFDQNPEAGSGHNLSDDASCGATFTQVADMALGTLGDYGGETETIPILVDSPAIDGRRRFCLS